MAYLNQLLSEKDLASLTSDERQFLVERIDSVLDTHPDVRKLVTERLQSALGALGKENVRTLAPEAATY